MIVAGRGEAVEADASGECLGHELPGILAIPVGEAGDQAGVRTDHRFDGFDALHVAALIHDPIHLLIQVRVNEHGMVDLVAGKPEDALRVGVLGGLADRFPTTVERLAAVGAV